MGRYIVRRLLIAVPTLLAISFVMYAILALAPIDPLSQFGADPRIPPEARDQIRHALGLDQPWPIRYLKWIQGMATGNFGYSFMSHSPVIELLLQRLPNTLAVVGVAYIVGFLIALPIGVFSAVRRNSIADHVFSTFAYFGFSVPTFFTGLVLIIIFSVKLHWLPFVYDSNLKIHDFGAIVTEQVFHVPGIGELLVRSIFQGDTPVVTAVLMIFAVLVVAFNLLADVLYAALDPRIRYS